MRAADAFCEGQDAPYVEFVDGLAMVVDLSEPLAPRGAVALPFVACRVDALSEQERVVHRRSNLGDSRLQRRLGLEAVNRRKVSTQSSVETKKSSASSPFRTKCRRPLTEVYFR